MLKLTLYFGNPARLNVANEQLRITLPPEPPDSGERIVTRPLEDIAIVIIDSPQISLTSSVLSGFSKYGVALIICNERHLPAGLMLEMEGNSLQSERFRIHISASQPLKKQMWQQTVIAKIRNQAAAMKIITGENPIALTRMAEKVKSGDSENVEAKAASYYWSVIMARFGGIRRHRDGEGPNPLLNYGYSIVRAMMARALVASGMHPSLGIFHRNKYNAYCLADDIMEPFRPYVDIMVMDIFDKFENPEVGMKSVKQQLLGICTKDVMINGLTYPMMTGISETAASVFKCYNGDSRKIRYPELTS